MKRSSVVVGTLLVVLGVEACAATRGDDVVGAHQSSAAFAEEYDAWDASAAEPALPEAREVVAIDGVVEVVPLAGDSPIGSVMWRDLLFRWGENGVSYPSQPTQPTDYPLLFRTDAQMAGLVTTLDDKKEEEGIWVRVDNQTEYDVKFLVSTLR